MTVRLHAQCRAHLVAALAEAIRNIQLDFGSVSDESLLLLAPLDAILPRERARLGLDGHFSDRPVLHFLLDVIGDDLRSANASSSMKELVQVEGYREPSAAAERLIAQFETLPWDYNLFFRSPLPATYRDVFGNAVVSLAEQLELVLLEPDSHAEIFPLRSAFAPGDRLLAALRHRDVPTEWDYTQYYVSATAAGFIGQFGSCDAVDHFVSRLKAFVGLLLVFGIAELEAPTLAKKTKAVLVFRSEAKHAHAAWLATEDSAGLSQTRARDVADLSRAQKRALTTLLPIVFRAENERIRGAARWYFDSYVGSNEMLSFVQAMVVLEILFGDKASSDVVGVGKLLANRCAYLIGRTHAERNQIITDIEKIYATRSAIVHRGKERLALEEKRQFVRLRELCAFSLAEELRSAASGA